MPQSRLLAPPGQALPAEGQALLADRFRSLYGQMLPSLLGNTLGLLIFVAVYWADAPRTQLLPWGAMILLLSLGRLLHYRRFAAAPDADDAQILAWSRSWRVLLHSQALCWALGIWLFYGLGGNFQLITMVVLTYCYCLAAIHLLTLVPRDLWFFLSLVLVSLIVNMAMDHQRPYNLELAAVLCVLYVIALVMGRTYHRTLRDAIELKVHSERLAAQLAVEKGLAIEAHRRAEAASQAKTQFFAAASHDLRQPLHALGLFAEALRQRSSDPEAARLINSINESVDALEGLFGELLDITRIDTGGVDVQPKAVPVRELFARLRLQFEPLAFEKGLMLSFRGEQHVLHTDPVLIERIVRNLVSNALRYTEDGGVLVSCRARGGQVLLQVWDSGIGIAPSALPRIFDEFYQVQSKRPLEAHHRKGLGLGLAIVKRLSALLQAPLDVRSRLGHGTVFSLLLPVGRAAPLQTESVPPSKLPLGLSLDGRLIVVVEDEAAVSEGLVVLLQAWGAEVLAFDSVAAVSAWASGPQAQRPDLLLVDYRLPDGLTGLDALSQVRGRFPSTPGIPAIMVTGSTMSGHELQAQQHDFHVLIKPVVPNKLRAMIAFKLGVR